MARLLVLTDRSSRDPDWKGALAWRIIQSLAESHHEVLVITPLTLESVTITHPRLTVVRPLESWRLDGLAKIAKVALGYQPQVIHSFAFQPSRLWPSLSIWPFLHTLSKMLPQATRFSTFFEPEDGGACDAIWHRGSARLTGFCEAHRAPLAHKFRRPVDLIPLDLDFELEPEPVDRGSTGAAPRRVLVPAPVSEWNSPEAGLEHLAEFLRRQPETSARIIGGWGGWIESERKAGWRALESVLARVTLSAPLSFADFRRELQSCDGVWLEPLRRDSWKALIGAQLALQMSKRLHVASPLKTALLSGSTANALSRLYSGVI